MAPPRRRLPARGSGRDGRRADTAVPTMSPSPANDARVRAFGAVHALEAQAHEIEACLAELKRLCLHDGDGASLQAAADDLRALVRQLHEDAAEADLALGVVGEGGRMPDRRGERRAEQRTLRGTTDVVSVADLFGFLSSLQKTGTLTIQAPDALFVFELQEGCVVHAATNLGDPELRLGTILVAQSLLTEAELHEHVAASAQAREMLGAHLVARRTVAADDLRGAIEEQVRRIFDAAFALPAARFVFTEGELSRIAQRAQVNTTHLLLEAARLDDERRRGGASALDGVLPA